MEANLISLEFLAEIGTLIAGGIAVYIKLKTDTTNNTNQIKSIRKELADSIDNNKERIQYLEEKHADAYNQLDRKVTKIEDEVKQIATSLGRIEGYLKAFLEKNN